MDLRLLPAAIALLAVTACGGGDSSAPTVTETVASSQEPGEEGVEPVGEESSAPTPANPVAIAKKVKGADCGDAKSGTNGDGTRYVTCILNEQDMLVTTYVGDPQQLGVVEPSDDTFSTVYGEDFTLFMWNGDVKAEAVARQVGGTVEPPLP